MKWVFSLVLCVVIMFAFTACSNNTAYNSYGSLPTAVSDTLKPTIRY